MVVNGADDTGGAGGGTGLEMIEPGLVPCTRWRPDPPGIGGAGPDVPHYGAVARKR